MSRTGRRAGVIAALLLTLVVAGPVHAAGDEVRTLFRFDDQVTESSGLVDLGERVLTINDSGDDAVVYVVDPTTGATVGRTTFADEVTDVEALTQGPDGDVWVGDIGDNGGDRSGIRVHRIERPTDGDRRVGSTTYDLVYDGGARDAETLLVSPSGRLMVVSKGLFSGQVWQAPERLSTDEVNVLRPVTDVGGMVTDGAWFPDGRHVVLRDYDVAWVYDAAEQPWRVVDRLDIPDLEQGEGVAVRRTGDLLISSEGSNQPVKLVAISDRLRERMSAQGQRAGDGDADEPAGADGKGVGVLVEGGAPLRRTLGIVVAGVLTVLLGMRLWRMRGR